MSDDVNNPATHRSEPTSDPIDEETPVGAPQGKKKSRKKRKKKVGAEGTSRGIETMFRMAYQTHLSLSSLADAKANIMISINGIIITVIIASVAPNMDRNPWLGVPASLLLLTCLVALVFSVLAARPRFSRNSIPIEELRSNRANILFFGNFVQMPESDFLEGVRGLMVHTDELYQTMAKDIYALGTVLDTKYRLLRIAYSVFMTGLVIGVVAFVAVLVIDPGAPASTFSP